MKKEILDQYVSRMTDIRTLSTPELKKLDSAGEYSERLRENFRQIGLLAQENRKILDQFIFPFAESEEPLTEDMIDMIRTFNDDLVDYQTVENLDSAIRSLLSDRLMRDAEQKGETAYLIRQLHDQIIVCHTFMYLTSRIATNQSICDHFRKEGIRAAKRIMEYLAPEKFKRLSEENKDSVLTVTRFYTTLWGSAGGTTAEQAHEWVLALDHAMKIYEDPFYHEVCPDYNWDYYLFRTHEYYSSILDYLYRTRVQPEDFEKIVLHVKAQEALWQSDPEKYDGYSLHPMILISYYQALYLNGETDTETYRKQLFELYRDRDRNAYDFDNLFVNLRCALDTILTMDPQHTSEREKALLGQFYHDALGYVFRMPNSGTLSELLELYTPLLMNFIEVPGKITFEEMCLRSLAAFHPPTYVHSRMVAYLSRCLCAHLIHYEPERFIGCLGVQSAEEVKERKDDLIRFTFHAALCHDFGKLPIIDTVFIYGRKLLDFEFGIIKQHPDLGAYLMSDYESTKAYVDVARGHHRWYDDSRGYPEDFETAKSPLKTIIDLVACADCMDAATDSIGRSYNQGKTLDDYEKELIEGAGTRYAPYLPGLIAKEEVREDLNYLLSEGRQMNYRNTFLLLREVQELGGGNEGEL